MPKRTYVELETLIVNSLQSYPKKTWELAESLNIEHNSCKTRLKRLEQRGAVHKVNGIWHYISASSRDHASAQEVYQEARSSSIEAASLKVGDNVGASHGQEAPSSPLDSPIIEPVCPECIRLRNRNQYLENEWGVSIPWVGLLCFISFLIGLLISVVV